MLSMISLCFCSSLTLSGCVSAPLWSWLAVSLLPLSDPGWLCLCSSLTLAGCVSPGVKLKPRNNLLLQGPVESVSRSRDLISQVVLRAPVATNGFCIMWLLKCMGSYWFISFASSQASPRVAPPGCFWLCWSVATRLFPSALIWGLMLISVRRPVQWIVSIT